MDCPNDRYVNDEEICQAVVVDARQDRRQGQPAGPDPRQVLRQDHSRRATTPASTCWAGRRRRYDVLERPQSTRSRRRDEQGNGPVQRRRLLATRSSTSWPTKIAGRDATRPSATRMIAEATKIHIDEVGLHPAAPAGAGLGDAQERRRSSSRPTTVFPLPLRAIVRLTPAAIGGGRSAGAPLRAVIACRRSAASLQAIARHAGGGARRVRAVRYVGDPGQQHGRAVTRRPRTARRLREQLGLNDRSACSSCASSGNAAARRFRPLLPAGAAGRAPDPGAHAGDARASLSRRRCSPLLLGVPMGVYTGLRRDAASSPRLCWRYRWSACRCRPS